PQVRTTPAPLRCLPFRDRATYLRGPDPVRGRGRRMVANRLGSVEPRPSACHHPRLKVASLEQVTQFPRHDDPLPATPLIDACSVPSTLSEVKAAYVRLASHTLGRCLVCVAATT